MQVRTTNDLRNYGDQCPVLAVQISIRISFGILNPFREREVVVVEADAPEAGLVRR